LPNDRPDYSADKKHFVLPRGPLLALGIIAFCGAVVEGSLMGWSGVFMKDQLGASDGMAPLAYAVFAATMLAARLVCDRLKECYGARRVVMLGSLLGAIGIFLAVLAPNATIAIPAFGLTGAGVAAIFPFVFSAAGRHGSTALAGVATMGYSGNLIGPPVIGFLAQGWGLQTAVAFIGVLSIVLALAASRAKWLV
jgi:MFS family permease